MVALAAPLVMADLFRHILQDTDLWRECGDNDSFSRVNVSWDDDACRWSSSQYRCTLQCCVPESPPDSTCECHCIPTEEERIANLSTIGWIFTIGFTYTGFALLSAGIMWNADICNKMGEIKKKWRAIRNGET